MSQLDRFVELVRQPRVPLGEGCLAIAAHLGHPMPVDVGLDLLDALAARTLVAAGSDPVDLDVVCRHLFGAEALRGNRAAYGDVRNSLLPEVLTRRTGIPITLAIIVMEVSDRLGVVATGVGMPGHFLVGDGRTPSRWVDPFEGGIGLDMAAARRRFQAIHGASATFDPTFLAPTPPLQTLGRVLANLAGVLRPTGDPTAVLRVLELRDVIPGVGNAPRARVELAGALAAVGRVGEAAEVLDDLGERLDPRRREALTDQIAVLRASLN